MVTYIFREGNCCVDSLANIGMSCNFILWMNWFHLQVRANYIRDS